MVRVPMTWTTMELLRLVCLCVLTWSGSTSADGNGKYVIVKQGEDAILPCSLSTKENIMSELFDWKKDGQKLMFRYDAGRTSQDDQFRGRVFHFPDQLKVGNASIVIKQAKVTDRGNYTCDFPNLRPRRQFHMELVVYLYILTGPILKDRTEEHIRGAARKPYVTALEPPNDNVLQCVVHGAFPKPKLQWQDGAKNNIFAKKPQVTESEGRYDVYLRTTVTKTDNYSCVVTQEEINHQVYSDIIEYVGGSGSLIGWVLGGVGVVLGVIGFVLYRWYKRRRRRQNDF